MRRRRTSSMSVRGRHCRSRLTVLCLFLAICACCVVLVTRLWTGSNVLMHSRHVSNKDYDEERLRTEINPVLDKSGDVFDDSVLYKDLPSTQPNVPEEPTVTAEVLKINNVDCGVNKIYFSNQYYDCDGIMKNPNEDNEKKPTAEEIQDKGQQKVPSLHNESTKKGNNGTETVTSRRIFLNCGSTLPIAIDLFLDTYPNAELFELYSFVSDKTYSILYNKYLNHTFVNAAVSVANLTQNEDIKTFGSADETTQSVQYVDIAAWIHANTKQSDNVIMLLDSKRERNILTHLVNTSALENIDKYYSSRALNNSEDIGSIQEVLDAAKLKVEVWDNIARMYSDFDSVNQKHIPTPGKTITQCTKADDSQKFLLLLYSSQASMNSLKVIKFLQAFSHSNRLITWIFLPYEFFKFPTISFDFKALFYTFHVGLYYNGEDKLPLSLRNKATFVNRIFEKHEAVLEYILVSNETDSSLIQYVQQKENYKFLKGGIDVTHLSSKLMTNGIINIDDTGKKDGDLLRINIDKTEADILTLYFIRRFIPWLLNLKSCF